MNAETDTRKTLQPAYLNESDGHEIPCFEGTHSKTHSNEALQNFNWKFH
jgi:hypothetical protein